MSPASVWVQRLRPDANAVLRLFCVPHAGAAPTTFYGWDVPLRPVELSAIELPGRGRRRKERPFQSVEALALGIADAITPDLDRPFALFGHSFGAAVAYELACELRRRGERTPRCVIVSARRAPHLPDREAPVATMSDAELIDHLRKLTGTPETALNDSELMQLVLPPLRADLQADEDYRRDADEPLDCPLYVFGGRQDPTVTDEELEAWAGHTNATFQLEMFEGTHFFFGKPPSRALDALSKILTPVA